ncbi:hypothetical protein V8F06_009263 [Rhypophila decipiens]
MANSDVIHHFKAHLVKYIRDHDCYGSDAFDKREFIPRDALSRFWTADQIVNVLCRTRQEERIRADRQNILQHYLAVFSILVYISRPELITTFMCTETPLDDAHLPIRSTPEEWTHDSELREVFTEFDKAQWRFCPLTLDRRPWKSKLAPYHIIPIASKRLIDPNSDEEEDEVLVYEADWHHLCRGPLLNSSRVVLKTYHMRTQAVTDSLNNEIDVYSNLEEPAFEHGKLTIILEHASRGNLLDLWEKNALPNTVQDRINLWESFFMLLQALDATHNLNPVAGTSQDTGQWVLKGMHQDIRPQNILVTETEGNSFIITFKLTDFGTGHVRRCRKHGFDHMAAQRQGNGMYGPPESVRDDYASRLQHCESDIWFLGSVASEHLVWSIKGNIHRLKYQEERQKATDKTQLRGGYHDGCFHDGECRLKVVDEIHRSVLESIDHDDLITPIASKVILNHMLVANVAERSNARDAYAAWKKEVDAVRHRVPPRRKGTNQSHMSGISGFPHRMSATDNFSSTQAFNRGSSPWLENTGEMQSEPGQHLGDDHFSRYNPTNSSHVQVQIGEQHGNGYAGPSSVHHRFGPGIGRGASRQGTSDSFGLGSPFQPIPEASSDETASGSTGQPFTLPFRPAGLFRSGTSASNRPLSFSPPSMPSRRTTVEDHFHVDEQGEASESAKRNCTGLNINQGSAGGDALPSPPKTPATKRARPQLSNRTAVTPAGRSFTTPRRATTIIADDAKITIDQVYHWIISPEKEKSSIRWAIPGRKAKPDPFVEFPRLGDAVKKLKGSKGREQIFIIDDARSMATHRYEMARTLRVLARLLKLGGVDPDKKFSVYHTCNLEATVELANATDLQNHITNHTFSSGACNIQDQLDDIMTTVLQCSRPVSIYVLTNAWWNALPENPDDLCGVDKVIERILSYNKRMLRQSNHVGFQFIRFFRHTPNPDDDEGKHRLDFLDNCLVEKFDKLELPKSDIVDTTDWDDDVPKMLLGGVFAEEDNAISPSRTNA